MPLDPDRALQGGVLDHLRADSALTAILGGPRVYDQPPDDAAYPMVTLGPVTTRPWGGVCAEGMEHVFTLTGVSRFGGMEEAKAIGAAVRASLDDAAIPLADNALINLRCVYGDVFRAADWRLTFAILRFRAVTEAA